MARRASPPAHTAGSAGGPLCGCPRRCWRGPATCYAWFVHERVKLSRRRGFTRLSSKRQVTLPLAVVQQLGLAPGDALRVDAEDDRIVLRRPDSLADRRLRALEQVAGSLADVYEPGYLDRLRDEWR